MKTKTLYLSIFAMAASSRLFATDYYYSLDGTYYGTTAPTDGSAYETISIDGTTKTATTTYATGNSGAVGKDLELYTVGASSTNGGGALLLQQNAASISGVFINNSTSASAYGGGAIFSNTSPTSLTIDGTFIYNRATAGDGGAIYNNGGTYNSISGTFIGNTASVYGGAIYNYYNSATYTGIINSIDATFISNSANYGGAIYNTSGSTIGTISGTFTNNSATTNGGAIYSTGSTTITTSGADTIFTGNTTGSSSAGYTSNAIYNTGTITFSSENGYKIVVNDGINGASESTLTISTGTTVFNNSVTDSAITVSDGATLELGSYAGTSDLLGDGSNISVSASSANISSALTVNGTLSLVVSASKSDLVNDIKISSTLTFGDNASVALDLSEIFGSFELSVSYFADLLAYFDSDFESSLLTVIFADTEISSTVSADSYEIDNVTYTYVIEDDESNEILAAFNVTNDGSTITISGFSNVAVPEPSTYAMIIGALALGFAYYRRRK